MNHTEQSRFVVALFVSCKPKFSKKNKKKKHHAAMRIVISDTAIHSAAETEQNSNKHQTSKQ
jgi:hypothetical protein